jgi:hypothetical protein
VVTAALFRPSELLQQGADVQGGAMLAGGHVLVQRSAHPGQVANFRIDSLSCDPRTLLDGLTRVRRVAPQRQEVLYLVQREADRLRTAGSCRQARSEWAKGQGMRAPTLKPRLVIWLACLHFPDVHS